MSDRVLDGKFKWYSENKGYGFVETDDGDVFVHAQVLKKVVPIPSMLKDGTPISVRVHRLREKWRGLEILSVGKREENIT